jgi:receptor protein-tyrosine kinase
MGKLTGGLSARQEVTEGNWLAVLWQRKVIVIVTLIVFVAATEIVTATLKRVYATSSTLIVAQPGRVQAFDTTQAAEEAARSYAKVLDSPNFAAEVAAAIDHGASGPSIQSAVSIAPVAQTQLLTITAEDPSPGRAKQIADAYSNLFVQFAPHLAGQTGATVTVADYAPRPTSPTRPRPLLYGLIAALLGLAAGVALAFLRQRFDVRIRNLDELPDDLRLPVLADVPPRKTTGIEDRAFGEAFRMLRTSIRMQFAIEAPRTIAITSWAEGEGKTTVVSELALAMSAGGTKTLAVDADIHRGGLSRLLTGTTDGRVEPGLTDYLLRAVEPEDAVIGVSAAAARASVRSDRREPDLELMPCGQPVTNLSNLLETSGGKATLPELRSSYELVIIDTPPLSIGADAPAIAARVDGVILILDLTTATTSGLRRALRQLESANATILGMVTNKDPHHVSASYSYYRYGDETNGHGKSLKESLFGRGRKARSREESRRS